MPRKSFGMITFMFVVWNESGDGVDGEEKEDKKGV